MISTAVATVRRLRRIGPPRDGARGRQDDGDDREPAPKRAETSSSQYGLRPAEHRVVPERRQLAVRDGSRDRERAARRRRRASAGADLFAAPHRHRRLLAGDERVVDRAAGLVEQHRIRGNDLAAGARRPRRRPRSSPAARSLSSLPLVLDANRRAGGTTGTMRSNAIAVERLLLEEPADQQEEHQAGEGVDEPLAAAGDDVERGCGRRATARPSAIGHVERHRAAAQRLPGGAEVVRRAEEQHRHREARGSARRTAAGTRDRAGRRWRSAEC